MIDQFHIENMKEELARALNKANEDAKLIADSIPISKIDDLIAVWEEEARPPVCEYSAEDFIKDLKQLKQK